MSEDPSVPSVHEPMGIGQLLSASMKLYLDHWKPLLAIAAVLLVPYAFVVQGLVTASGLESLESGAPPPPEVILGALGPLFAVLFIAFFVNPLVTAALSRAGADLYIGIGRPVTVGEAYRVALGRLGPVLAVVVLGGLLVLGVALAFLIPGAVLLGLAEQGPRPWMPVVAIPLVLGGIVAVVAVAIRLTVAPVAVVLEPVRGREALSRSWKLVQGQGWRVLGAVLLMGILSVVVSALLASPFIRLGRALESGGWLLAGLGEALANVVTTPFTAVVLVLLYFDLRLRKESFDPSLPSPELAPPAPGDV